MTATITHTAVGDYTIDLANGLPVEVCAKCGGRGYLPGYEFIDNAPLLELHGRPVRQHEVDQRGR